MVVPSLMLLAAGVRIGSYQVLDALGQGGMGEVYRARDTRLGRQVALKILPESLAQDPDRLARFEREAQVLASLNHPNIAQIHGVEDVGAGVLGATSRTVLVMELVEGPTLAEVIGSGLEARGSAAGQRSSPLPITNTLAIARQIAEALEAAHAQGIVHRDLKPANVKVKADGTVKVLDFGLAKALAPASVEAVSTAIAESPTLTSPAVTQRGVILGTPAYMAPEQARGKIVDRRADIWAFGCVVYEMLTGSRPFDGEDVSEVLARIIDREPDWQRLPPNLPPVFARFLRQCLQKNPKQRVHDIADVRLALDGAFEVPATPAASARWPLGARLAVVGLTLLAIAMMAVTWYSRSIPVSTAVAGMPLDVDLGPDLAFENSPGPAVQISPAGDRLVILANGRILTRRASQPALVTLPGTEGATGFFLKPDGSELAFAAGGKLKKLTLDGGAVVTICDLVAFRGGSWGEDGSMVVAAGGLGSLLRIPPTGGGPVPLTRLVNGELTHRWPQIVPGGRGVLFTVHTQPSDFDVARVEYLAFADGSRKRLVENATFGRLFIGADGSAYLLYLHEGTIFAAPFDLERVKVTGAAFRFVEGVDYNVVGSAQFDTSRTGTLVYRSQVPRRLDWLERSGPPSVLLDRSGDYRTASLSPDGRRIAYVQGQDLWVRDVERGNPIRAARGVKGVHVWVPPDGQFIIFGDATTKLLWTRADGSTEPQVLVPAAAGVQRSPTDVNRNGTLLAFMELRSGEQRGWDLWTVPLKVEGAALRALKPEPFLSTELDERSLVFSDDDRLVAYSSSEAGSNAVQVFVRMLPDDGRKWQMSTDGGQIPRFAGDRSLFFIGPKDIITRTSYAFAAGGLVPGTPEVWSRQGVESSYLSYTVGPTGSRVAALVPDPASKTRAERYVTFWSGAFDEIRRQDPAAR